MTTRILLLDQEPVEGELLGSWLRDHGLTTEVIAEAEPLFRRLAAADPPWLLLLHRRLRLEPDLGLLRRIRALSPIPVLLRALDHDDEADRVQAIEAGADDYLTCGTSHRELLARIRSVLRRSRGLTAPTPGAVPRFSLCLRRRELFGPDGEPRNLTSAEFDLLQILARQQGAPVSRETLSQAVLRRPYHPEDRALDNLVLRLRRRLSDEGDAPQHIKSVRGVGYVFTGFDVAETRPRTAEAPMLVDANIHY